LEGVDQVIPAGGAFATIDRQPIAGWRLIPLQAKP
jgi:hypothetical protein